MKVFHHNDCDGRAAAAVVAMYEDLYDNKEDFFEVNYIEPLPINKISKDEKVYFVDYSFSINTVNVLREILSITKNVVWIDHHQSSLDMIKKNPDLKAIRGIIQEGISGAALAYMYLYACDYEGIPLYLKYVSDFDCWHLKLPNIMEFKYGFECYDYTALSDFWVRMDAYDKGNENVFLDEVIEKGKIAKEYCDREYERYRKENSYEVDIEGHKALVINRDGFSQLFGEEFNNYDICLIWHYTGKVYSYSIYSKGTVDVSKIAEKYGGGGHPGASGWSSDKPLFL